MRWTITRLDLGRHTCETRVRKTTVRLDLYDGGGFCASIGVWRVGGLVTRIDEAGQC